MPRFDGVDVFKRVRGVVVHRDGGGVAATAGGSAALLRLRRHDSGLSPALQLVPTPLAQVILGRDALITSVPELTPRRVPPRCSVVAKHAG